MQEGWSNQAGDDFKRFCLKRDIFTFFNSICTKRAHKPTSFGTHFHFPNKFSCIIFIVYIKGQHDLPFHLHLMCPHRSPHHHYYLLLVHFQCFLLRVGFYVDAVGEGFDCALVNDHLLLELFMHFLECFTRLRAHACLLAGRLLLLIP